MIADDCNDLNGSVYPGASEVCNLTDDDCDGYIDEDVQLTFMRTLTAMGMEIWHQLALHALHHPDLFQTMMTVTIPILLFIPVL